MSKECNYVTKKEVKEYKKIMEETIPKVKNDTNKEFGKSFNYQIVGSAKRNLVVQKGQSLWDVDYQLMFLSPVFNDVCPPKLKIFIAASFAKHLGKQYSVKLSRSVITICLRSDAGNHSIKSFDVALIKTNPETANKEILRGKTDDKTSTDYIKWEELKNSKGVYEKRTEIKGSDMWKTLREIFLKKKCINIVKNKDEQIPTYAIFLESIKETLDKY